MNALEGCNSIASSTAKQEPNMNRYRFPPHKLCIANTTINCQPYHSKGRPFTRFRRISLLRYSCHLVNTQKTNSFSLVLKAHHWQWQFYVLPRSLFPVSASDSCIRDKVPSFCGRSHYNFSGFDSWRNTELLYSSKLCANMRIFIQLHYYFPSQFVCVSEYSFVDAIPLYQSKIAHLYQSTHPTVLVKLSTVPLKWPLCFELGTVWR